MHFWDIKEWDGKFRTVESDTDFTKSEREQPEVLMKYCDGVINKVTRRYFIETLEARGHKFGFHDGWKYHHYVFFHAQENCNCQHRGRD